MQINPEKLIEKYYPKFPVAYHYLVNHSRAVTQKALEIAVANKKLKLDLKFIQEAAMLHDIGIFQVYAPQIGCYGQKPYICHGWEGRKILEKEELPKHALVCERHVGAGISKEEIGKQNLPLPHRNMIPLSLEEKIICVADKFYSKRDTGKELSIEEIIKELSLYGKDKVKRFQSWLKLLGLLKC